MKIKVTEIETTAEELKNSNSVSDGFVNVLRNVFNSIGGYGYSSECEYEESEDENE